MNNRQSVIVPVKNGAVYIAVALQSALVQLAADDEIIVIDNGSSDNTVSVVRAIRDPRIRLIEESTPGPASARNAGLRAASGALVSFLDHDD